MGKGNSCSRYKPARDDSSNERTTRSAFVCEGKPKGYARKLGYIPEATTRQIQLRKTRKITTEMDK